jgi:exonuclease VII small subunit
MKVLTQEEYEALVKANNDLCQIIEDICIESNELGLEPTIPSTETGEAIVKRWSESLKKIKKML